jgi:acetyl esterase/lipase
VALCVLAASMLPGCLPIPDLRPPLAVPAPEYRLVPAAVASDYVSFPGAFEPHTPPRFNRSFALRFRGPEAPRTVLVLMPGLFGGASSLEFVARRLVAATPGLQVWVVDRRSNALEDHRGFDAARRRSDPRLAVRYYLGENGAAPDFAPPDDDTLTYMGYWGLAVHLEDLAAVVDAARGEAPRVLLGGHSLGAALVALYAAWRRPDGTVGGDGLDGLVLLDGVPGRTGSFDERDIGDGWWVLGIPVVPSTKALEAGTGRPYLSYGLAPMRIVRDEVIALMAYQRPEARAPSGLTDVAMTNEALAGLAIDARYGAVPLFSPQVGEPIGARFAGNLPAFLLGGADGASSRTVVGVAGGADEIRWGPGDPPEPTDLRSYVATAVTRYTDRSEWYFPTRLLLDIAALDVDPGASPGFVPASEVRVPTLAIGAGRGLVRSVDGFAGYGNTRVGSTFTAYVVPGLTHIDLVYARAAPVVTLVRRWSGSLP